MAIWTPEHNTYLSCLLDDVTGTEEMVKTRQDLCVAWDCMKSYPCYNQSYYTGSKAEGLDLDGSDFDFMYDMNTTYDIDASESLQDLFQSTHTHKFLIVTEKRSTWFCFLEVHQSNTSSTFISFISKHQ